jgi:predicted 3-demethylubiquinone-9 3-methyltransferase (glyoxalase superfamily)
MDAHALAHHLSLKETTLAIQKITPFLWFDTQAEEAANFYVSIFPDSKVVKILRYGPGMPMPAGSVMTVEFQLGGQTSIAFNGGPHFKFTEAVSFVVNCESQAEVDEYWGRLTAGGSEIQCGWLKDKYGLAWQIVPVQLFILLSDSDPARASRATQAMMKMKKLDIAALEAARDGK